MPRDWLRYCSITELAHLFYEDEDEGKSVSEMTYHVARRTLSHSVNQHA